MASLPGSEDFIKNESEEFCRFNQTLEKLSKNKINKNNAFESRIINEIDAFFQKSSLVLNEFEWNKYTTWLDGSGKIYGLCVDFLYDESIKVLGGVNRSSIEEVVDQNNFVYKRTAEAPNTLEKNDAAINCFSYEKIIPINPYFKAMSKKFDSSTSDSWLLNISTINSELEFVLTADDKVFSSVSKPTRAEVNLEGMLLYSLNEEVDFCRNLSEMEAKVFQSPTKCFEDVFAKIESNEDFYFKIDQNSSSDDSEKPEIIEEKSWDHSYQSIKDRIKCYDDFSYLTSKTQFPTGELTENVTKKSKKRKREQKWEEEPEEHIFAMIKIEEDENGVNLLKEAEKRPHKIEKKRFDYRKGRLGELFSRFGKFARISNIEKGSLDPYQNDDPLCMKSFEPIEHSLLSIDSGYLDIRCLKDAIWKIIKEIPNCEFLNIINEVPNHLKDAKNVSVHSCFVTVLHLANEHHLFLKETSALNFEIIHDIE